MSRARAWESPGPVSDAFLAAPEPVSVLMGPAGGGKTVTALQRGVFKSLTWPETEPGLRHVRFLVLRQRMTEIEGSTLLSWFNWFPKDKNFHGKEGSPKRHELNLAHPHGGRVKLEVHFKGIGEQTVDDALRGFEFSYAYVDECDLADEAMMDSLYKRAGRFPPPAPGRSLDENPAQVWGTCNAPEPDSWVVRELIDSSRPGWRLYRQPSGLSPQAENLKALGANFYQQKAASMASYERRRFIENIPGLLRDASAVYEEFDPDRHIAAAALRPVPQLPLYLGLDAGGTPGATLHQVMPNGQRRFLAELSTHARDMGSIVGPDRFAETLGVIIDQRFRGMTIRGTCDPSAAYGADSVAGEHNWIEIVSRILGVPILPAPTNDPVLRIEALRQPMLRTIDGRTPALLLCPLHCPLLARALARDYRFSVTAGRRSPLPDKRGWASHLVDAAQYAALDDGGFHQVTQRDRAGGMSRSRRVAPFNPFNRPKGAVA